MDGNTVMHKTLDMSNFVDKTLNKTLLTLRINSQGGKYDVNTVCTEIQDYNVPAQKSLTVVSFLTG